MVSKMRKYPVSCNYAQGKMTHTDLLETIVMEQELKEPLVANNISRMNRIYSFKLGTGLSSTSLGTWHYTGGPKLRQVKWPASEELWVIICERLLSARTLSRTL